jgi:hypothetical protein
VAHFALNVVPPRTALPRRSSAVTVDDRAPIVGRRPLEHCRRERTQGRVAAGAKPGDLGWRELVAQHSARLDGFEQRHRSIGPA